MSEMAYGFDAVQLTMDAMLSSCCGEDEEEGGEGGEGEGKRKEEDTVKGDMAIADSDPGPISEKILELAEHPMTPSSSAPSHQLNTPSQIHSLPFRTKRSAAYERWLSAPDTPYRRVRALWQLSSSIFSFLPSLFLSH